MKFSIKIDNLATGQEAYLGHNGKTAWSRKTAVKYFKECLKLDHFKDCILTIEPA